VILDEWEIIAWFLVGLFTDNLLGMLYAWKLGPDRAERLVIASLLNQTVIERIRTAWDFPRASEVSRMRHDMDSVLDRTVKEVQDSVRDIEVVIPEVPPATVNVDLDPDTYKVLRHKFKTAVDEVMEKYMEELKKQPDMEEQYAQANAEMELLELGGLLVEAGVPESWVQLGMRYGLPIFKRMAIERYPELMEGLTGEGQY